MISAIRDLVAYYRQHYHVPITCVSEAWELESWDKTGLLVAMPGATDDANDKKIDKLAFGHDPDYGIKLGGDLVIMHDLPIARIGAQAIVFLILPTNKSATDLARSILEKHLPRLCRTYRHDLRDTLIDSITGCVQDRKKELQSSIREDSYELERLSLQVMQLSRKLETDRNLLQMFQRSPEWIRNRANHTFVDLMKLVPGVYERIICDDEVVMGTTYPIDIEHDGYTYHFDAYEIDINIREGKVYIRGGTNVNGYIHPHVTDDKGNICWGNIGHLVPRLTGELDLFGLFQLVHQFLTSYNASDPFQKIKKWDPDYEEPDDEEEPYCSFCDSYGHDIGSCDECWWCSHCNEYCDHDEEDCPNRPKPEEEEAADAVVEAA